jgi:hypothetical protein
VTLKGLLLEPKLSRPDILVIDLRKPDEVATHQCAHAVLGVPKLRTVLDPVLSYYAKFVAFAEREVTKLRRFHSPNHQTDMLDLLGKLLT